MDQTINNAETTIIEFISQSAGLEKRDSITGEMTILQRVDGKTIRFPVQTIEEVLTRADSDGKSFLQVNFLDGRKILLTEKLIGFKPAETKGLDLKKLPRVVTTPDLVSVVEAIEESLSSSNPRADEVDVLRRVFDAVLTGAEAVGFEVESEKQWVNCISTIRSKPSA